MKTSLTLLTFWLLVGGAFGGERARPNVLIILTDDQGFGELGVTGNPVVRTPHIDALAAQSVSLTNFHVMPVCSLTRASLLTGRYPYRTGVVDTFMGRSLMHPDEKTLPEMLAADGYRTGIFGKWHLGDNYPLRAMDRGFQESLVLNGGGLAQPGDPPDPADERGAYFNAVLRHNGAWTKTNGYVSDVITEAAIGFLRERHEQPTFTYLAFNCPHAPHQVPPKYLAHYAGRDFSAAAFPAGGHPMSGKNDPSDLAAVYGMIENIDDNVGRVLAELERSGQAENTIVVFFSDNGCQQHGGYNAGFQGWKGTTLEGGIHQFCFVRWPAALPAGRKVDRIAAQMDLTPTLLELCGVAAPPVAFDGNSLAPLLRGEKVEWPARSLFFQWHRGDAPVAGRDYAVRTQEWKLVQPLGVPENWKGKPAVQLYDMAHDPLEMKDLAAERPEMVASLQAQYEAWFREVTSGRDYASPARIYLGAPLEDPVLFTRQDWRVKAEEATGAWEVKVARGGEYTFTVQFEPRTVAGEAVLRIGGGERRRPVEAGATQCVFSAVRLEAGNARLEPGLTGGGITYVQVHRAE